MTMTEAIRSPHPELYPKFSRIVTLRSLVLAAPLVLVGCIDSDAPRDPDADPSEPLPALDPCTATAGLQLTMIEDFEGEQASYFWSNDDGSPTAQLEPPSSAPEPPPVPIAGEGLCDGANTTKAYRLQASGLRIWGASFGVDFPEENGVDASRYDGIVLWVRHGEISGRSMFLQLNQPTTDSRFGDCVSDADIVSENCDAFGAGLGLSSEWRFFKIPFAVMEQRGFGMPADDPQLASIFGFQFTLERGNWDIWLDDLAWYNEP